MGLLGIGSASVASPVAGVQGATAAAKTTGGGLSFGVQQAVSGAMSAQPGSGASIIKRVLLGGALGGALGFGASFLSLPVIGGMAAPVVAAIGGGIGAALGLVSGLLARRKARANGTLTSAIAPGAGVAPNIIPKPKPTGRTIRIGSAGSSVKAMQRNLKTLGLYSGKITGKFDAKLAASIKNYEVMKGVQPTGESTGPMRVALGQDAALKNRFA